MLPYVRWDTTTNTGDGLVVGWSRSNELTGTADWKGDQALAKLVMDLKLFDYRDRLEEMVTILKEFRCESPNDFAALACGRCQPPEGPRCGGLTVL